jgi:amino acid transporter
MNWKNFIRGLLVTTIIFGLILLFIVLTTSPEKSMVTIIAFFVSLFFFLFGLATAIGFYLRRWWMHNEVLFANVKVAVRQGFLVSAFFCTLLILSATRLLTWWDGVILAISFLLIELYFKTRN